MSSIINWLGRAMGDGDNPSSMRLIAVTTVPFLSVAPVLVWAILSLHQGKLLDFPSSVTGYGPLMVTTILGALHLNKREETKSP